jgi:hypothetical protein
LDWELVDQLSVKDSILSRKALTMDSMKPFEVREHEKVRYVGIPSNINELIRENYLVLLFCLSFKKMGWVEVTVPKPLTTMLKLSEQQNAYLHGFGIHLVNGQMMNLRSDYRGAFKKGVLSACRCIVGKIKGVDTRWFKYGGEDSPVTALFGHSGNIHNVLEKSLLDHVINACKTSLDVSDAIVTYLKSEQDIKKEIGLTAKQHTNKLFSTEERDALSMDHKDYIAFCKDKFPEFKDWNSLKSFQELCQQTIKVGKVYKDKCQIEIDSRLTFLFSGKKKNKKDTPIDQLINQKKGTKEYINTFMPYRALGVKPYAIAAIPSSELEMTAFRKNIDEYRVSCGRANMDLGRVSILINFIMSNFN